MKRRPRRSACRTWPGERGLRRGCCRGGRSAGWGRRRWCRDRVHARHCMVLLDTGRAAAEHHDGAPRPAPPLSAWLTRSALSGRCMRTVAICPIGPVRPVRSSSSELTRELWNTSYSATRRFSWPTRTGRRLPSLTSAWTRSASDFAGRSTHWPPAHPSMPQPWPSTATL